MHAPLKVRIYAIAGLQTTLVGGLKRRMSPEMVAMDGEKPIFVVMPASVDDRKARASESFSD